MIDLLEALADRRPDRGQLLERSLILCIELNLPRADLGRAIRDLGLEGLQRILQLVGSLCLFLLFCGHDLDVLQDLIQVFRGIDGLADGISSLLKRLDVVAHLCGQRLQVAEVFLCLGNEVLEPRDILLERERHVGGVTELLHLPLNVVRGFCGTIESNIGPPLRPLEALGLILKG